MKTPYRYQFVNYREGCFQRHVWSDISDDIVDFVEENNIEYKCIRRYPEGEYIEVTSLEDYTLLKLTFGVNDVS